MKWVKAGGLWHQTSESVSPLKVAAVLLNPRSRPAPWTTACGVSASGVLFDAPADAAPKCSDPACSV